MDSDTKSTQELVAYLIEMELRIQKGTREKGKTSKTEQQNSGAKDKADSGQKQC
jgi:hypothetical protein